MKIKEETFGKNLILSISLDKIDINNRKETEFKLVDYIDAHPLRYFAVQMQNDCIKNYPIFEAAFNRVAKLDEN